MRINAREAAVLTGLSPRTLLTWAAAGRVPGAARLGRRIVFDKQRLLQWIEEHTIPCRKISIGAAAPSGRAPASSARKYAEAYAQLMQLKPAAGSRPSGKTSRANAPSRTETRRGRSQSADT